MNFDLKKFSYVHLFEISDFIIFKNGIHGLTYQVARKNVPNFRMALCNRVSEMNQQKSMYANIFEYVYEFSPKMLYICMP